MLPEYEDNDEDDDGDGDDDDDGDEDDNAACNRKVHILQRRQGLLRTHTGLDSSPKLSPEIPDHDQNDDQDHN